VERDEIVGYHLEQAAGYHEELGGRREDLAARAGEYLAAAGLRAASRDDSPAALKLFTRALALFPHGGPAWQGAFLDRLSLLLDSAPEEVPAAIETLEQSLDPRLVMHARLTRMTLAIEAASAGSSEEGSALVREANELFAPIGDDRGLAAAADIEAQLAWVRSNAAETLAAVERFRLHAARAKAVAFVGRNNVIRFGPVIWGPFRPEEMRAAVASLPADAPPRHTVEAVIAEREGRYEDALAHTAANLARFEELGIRGLQTAAIGSRADVLTKLKRFEDAERAYQELFALHEEFGQAAYLSTALLYYADFRYTLGDTTEALDLADRGEALGVAEDVINFAMAARLRA